MTHTIEELEGLYKAYYEAMLNASEAYRHLLGSKEPGGWDNPLWVKHKAAEDKEAKAAEDVSAAVLCNGEELVQRVKELEANFNLQRRADQRAIKMWHDAGGNKLEWPDHADLVVWLLERIDELKATLDDEEASHQDVINLWLAAKLRVAELEAALEMCDVSMGTAALCGLPQELPPAYRDSWARAHRAARAALARSEARP